MAVEHPQQGKETDGKEMALTALSHGVPKLFVSDNKKAPENDLQKLLNFPYTRSLQANGIYSNDLKAFNVSGKGKLNDRAFPLIKDQNVQFFVMKHSEGVGMVIVDDTLQTIHFVDGYSEWSRHIRKEVKDALKLTNYEVCNNTTPSTNRVERGKRSGPWCVYAAHSYVINHPAMQSGRAPIEKRKCPELHVGDLLAFWRLMTYTAS